MNLFAGIEVFAFLLNDSAAAAMPKNALRLRALVYQLAGEAPPRPPKAPKLTVESFFAPKAKVCRLGVKG